MARDFEFSIIAKFKDAASRGVRRLSRRLKSSFGGGLLRGLAGGLTGVFGGLAGVATKVAGGIVSTFTRALGGLVRLFQKVVSTITSLLWKIGKVAGVAAAGAAAAFAVLWWQVAKAGDRLAKMSKRTGLAVEFLSELDHVARLNDTSLEAVQIGLRGLGRAVEGAARRSEEYLEIWRQLGVPLRDNAGRLRATENLFWDLLDALAKVENRTLRMGLAQRIFGRSGEALLVMVDAGTDALREQREETRRLGATWSQEYAAAAERAMDSMTKLRTIWLALKKTFWAPFLEPVAKMFERFSEALAGTLKQVQEWGRAAAKAFEKAARAIGVRLRAAYNWLTTRDWSLGNLKEVLSAIPGMLRKHLPQIGLLIKAQFELMKLDAMGVIDAVAVHLDRVLNAKLLDLSRRVQDVGMKMAEAGIQGSDVMRLRRMSFWEQQKCAWGHPLTAAYVGLQNLFGSLNPAAAAKVKLGQGIERAGLGIQDIATGATDRAAAAPDAARQREAARGIWQEIRGGQLRKEQELLLEQLEDMSDAMTEGQRDLSDKYSMTTRRLETLERKVRQLSTARA